jgi:hypothetical protein
MTSPARSPRARLAALVVCASILTACAPTPEPIPDPTPSPLFASEAEAYAAAEATYTAYNDALNAVDFRDSDSFKPVYSFLTGVAEQSTRKAFSELYAEKARTTGATVFDSFTGDSVDLATGLVEVRLCVDVSDVAIVDGSGVSMVSPDRPSRQSLAISLLALDDQQGLLISEITPSKESVC